MDRAAPASRRPSRAPAPRRWRRLGGRAALVVAIAASLVWTGTELRERAAARAAHPLESGRLEVAGLEQPVRIVRDHHGVPHIEARSERDALFALGFVQAQDRSGQLLRLRRRARGTAAEVEGTAALAGDRLARLLDFRGLAEAQASQLDPEMRRLLEAFSEGVNARLERVRRGDAAPPVGLGEPLSIEPWRPEDSLAIYKLFAWSLASSLEASLVLSDLVERLGATAATRFFPPLRAPEWPERSAAHSDYPDPAGWVEEGALALRRELGLAGLGVGSSAFVLGGAHTESGLPLLLADSHFEPTAPAALHLAHLRAPGRDVAGAVLAGVPVFWWGRTPELSWACVGAGVVVSDLYVETLRGDGTYYDGRRWRALDVREETLRVRGGRDRTLRIRRTRHGPVLPESEAEAETALALAWSGARGGAAGGIGSLWALSRAADGDGVREALRAHHEPVVAVAWASAGGGAGVQLAGWIPQRPLASRLLPLPGRARWYDWRDAVPFDALPAPRVADGRGYRIAADQRWELEGDAPSFDMLWRTGARTRRLEELLEGRRAAGGADLRGLAALQGDVVLGRSREVVRLATALASQADARSPGQEAAELERLLRSWDGQADVESRGSSAYHVFLRSLTRALFAERLGADLLARYLAVPSVDVEALVYGVLADAVAGGAGDGWSDPGRVRRAVRESLREAWLALSFELGPDPRRWSWGRLHALRFRRPAGEALGPFPYGGGPHAVQVADHAATGAFDVRVAAVARFAVDAGALDLALVALAPGQSEHPTHPHFDEGLERWLAGRYALLTTRRLDIEDRSVAQLELEPVR